MYVCARVCGQDRCWPSKRRRVPSGRCSPAPRLGGRGSERPIRAGRLASFKKIFLTRRASHRRAHVERITIKWLGEAAAIAPPGTETGANQTAPASFSFRRSMGARPARCGSMGQRLRPEPCRQVGGEESRGNGVAESRRDS